MRLKLHWVDNFPVCLFHLVIDYKYFLSKTTLQALSAQDIFEDLSLELLTKPRTKNALTYLFITLDSEISVICQYFELLSTWVNKCDFKCRSDSLHSDYGEIMLHCGNQETRVTSLPINGHLKFLVMFPVLS